MIDYRFLSSNYVSGLEFMDFQNSTLFEDLKKALSDVITEEGYISEEPDDLFAIIEKHTGFKNMKLELIDYGNLAIDAGFINPGNAFDIPDIEHWLSRSDSTLARWYKTNKSTFMRGTIDYRTGKVGGAYADLPFTLYINRYIHEFLSVKEAKRLNTTMADALAAFIIHELGHAYGGVMMIHQPVEDSIIMRGAISFLAKQQKTEDKVIVLKEAATLIDPENKIDDKTLAQLAELDEKDSYFVFFAKAAGARNTRRSLSLGVPEMNSEVIADAYSVRMGCGKALVYGLSTIYARGREGRFRNFLIWGIVVALFGGILLLPMYVIGYIVWRLISFSVSLIPGTYNTDYRRMMDVFSEMISKLKNDKTLSSIEQRKLLTQITKVQDVLKDNKPFLEDTAFQRFMLWIANGADGKFINIEHYTKMITDHSVNATGLRIANL